MEEIRYLSGALGTHSHKCRSFTSTLGVMKEKLVRWLMEFYSRRFHWNTVQTKSCLTGHGWSRGVPCTIHAFAIGEVNFETQESTNDDTYVHSLVGF